MRNIEPDSREDLIFTLVFALKHHVPPGHLRAIASRRPTPPGAMEDLDERIVAGIILEHLARCGWEVRKRPGFGAKGSASVPPGGPGRSA